MRESAVRRQVIALLKDQGFFVVPFPGSIFGMAGIPDLIAVRRHPETGEGETLWVELKAPGGRLSGTQTVRIKQLTDHGAQVVVVRSRDELAKHLNAGQR